MEEKKSYLLGIVGGLLGGIIGSIPWILFYVYANMIYSLLAIFIAMCALKGYELFRGKIDKSLPWIIAIISLVSVSIATLVIIPNLLLFKEVGVISLANLKFIYSDSEFISALIKDYIISLIFTFLGIMMIISNLKKSVNLESDKTDLNNQETNISEEKKEEILNYFIRNKAHTKKTGIFEDELVNEFKDIEDINYLVSINVLTKYKDVYYYVLPSVKNKRSKIITLVVIIILFGIGILFSDSSNSDIDTGNRVVEYDLPSDYIEYENEYDGWYYVPKTDISGNFGGIDVSFDEVDYSFSGIEEFMSIVSESFKDYSITSTSNYVNDLGNAVAVYKLDFPDYEEYIYYVIKDNKYAIIDGINNKENLKNSLESTVKSIADSFDWK